jgi:hypothetical protein
MLLLDPLDNFDQASYYRREPSGEPGKEKVAHGGTVGVINGALMENTSDM